MRNILDILEEDARTPPNQIASRLGLDEDAVRRQIADWEAGKVIRKYKAVVDRAALGEEPVTAFIDVAVTPQRSAGFDEVAARIARFAEVRSVVLVSGGHDLRVEVVGDDIRQVANFVAQKLATLERVTATNTHFVLKRYKEDGELLIESDADHRLPVTP
jgi:DNA-binding Lrp family transcriptional regulator